MSDFDEVLQMAISLTNNKSYDLVIKILTESIPDAKTNDDFGKLYGIRAAAYGMIGNETQAIADYKKAADYGDTVAIDILSKLGVNYTPQKPSTSSGSGGGFGMGGSLSASPPKPVQPAKTPYPANTGGISEEEFYRYEKAAKQGDADSCFMMGQAYMFNSYEKSEEWLNKAIALGNKEAKKVLKEVKKMWNR